MQSQLQTNAIIGRQMLLQATTLYVELGLTDGLVKSVYRLSCILMYRLPVVDARWPYRLGGHQANSCTMWVHSAAAKLLKK